MAVCCQNLMLCVLRSRSALSLLVGALYKSSVSIWTCLVQLCVASVADQSWKNAISWAEWKTSLACSTFRSPLNTDHIVICQTYKKYSSYIMVQWTSHPATKCVSVQRQSELHSVCTQSNNVAIRLYRGTEVMFLMTLLYSQIKTATEKQCFAILDIRGWYRTGLCNFRITTYIPLKRTTRPGEMDCKWHNI